MPFFLISYKLRLRYVYIISAAIITPAFAPAADAALIIVTAASGPLFFLKDNNHKNGPFR